ncbi:hypothetical protein CEE37_00320 [candidate division LCP-89 bacterium B3_LCP]|uniref:Secretion system C-terminal sorting domain-containing protein n=1 Tax=candidate division LCP-89 bacterium B3_LCP TaxID=2012998 RepID=A0A532V4M9_UNCL8|nr:MAG: hypothetical protein CEE37_00320 [candidate division LCP-89 bacterium B3_LCP]
MKRLILVFVSLMLLSYALCSAETILVSGNVYGVWDADTVLVQGELYVPQDSSLTIMPGVEVLFIVNCKLFVQTNATLWAVGTEMDPIRFDALNAGTFWHGIRFLSAQDSSRLERCTLKRGWASGADNSGGALKFQSCSPIITHCIIDSCKANNDGGAIYGGYSNVTFDNCTVTNNYAGDDGGAMIFDECNPVIANCTISNNSAGDDGGAIFTFWSFADLIGNTLSGNSSGDYGGAIVSCYSYDIIQDNVIEYNSASGSSGGILVFDSGSSITGNIISNNSAVNYGGGIKCEGPLAPTISDNIIINNTSSLGGGIYCYDVSAIISNNIISNNTSMGGGGIRCNGSGCVINNNFITSNTVTGGGIGGGMEIIGSFHVITDNIIGYNSAADYGGIYIWNGFPLDIRGNSFVSNTAEGLCGGIYVYNSDGTFSNNTIRDNTSSTGGGLNIEHSSLTITNLIVRGNTPFQITGTSPTITYSNIEGGWPGTGNIDADPMFATEAQAYSDILWGSPCIDTGNPDPIYLDPDNTVSDMGACYFDQSKPVRMLATPYDAPIVIPEAGSSFNFLLTLSNNTANPQATNIWCDITLPSGFVYGPVIGPIAVTSSANSNISRLRTQNVPPAAPPGIYYYNAYAVVGTDTSKRSFRFAKLGSTVGDALSGWENYGDPFEGPIAFTTLENAQPEDYTLCQNYPNPFNPTTVLSFKLQDASFVNLVVYDLSGRKVAELVNGWRDAGVHEVTFDASGLTSGLYIYCMQAGDFNASGKMVLLK